ncbi:MAG: hypothetical protein HOC66_06980, partial [Flavobacteriales bacterium]|nr:hypothetical protein [Flavobacteriales bacterium]
MRYSFLIFTLLLYFSCGDNTEKNEKNDTVDSPYLREITQEMLDDGYTGKGTYFSIEGWKYEGEWKDGKKHGKGTYIHNDG